MRPLQNITKVAISSFRRKPESSGFKDFLDSPVKPGNDGKMGFAKVSIIKFFIINRHHKEI
jgi:hypothetical protein